MDLIVIADWYGVDNFFISRTAVCPIGHSKKDCFVHSRYRKMYVRILWEHNEFTGSRSRVLYKPLFFHWNGQRIKRQSARASFIKGFRFPVLRQSCSSGVDDYPNVNNVNRYPPCFFFEEYTGNGRLIFNLASEYGRNYILYDGILKKQ
jgi:hypothetical protein